MAMGLHSRHDARKRKEASMTEQQKQKRKECQRKYAKKRYRKKRKELIARSTQYGKEIREIRKELNQCTNCGGEKSIQKFSWCSECRLENRINKKARLLQKNQLKPTKEKTIK